MKRLIIVIVLVIGTLFGAIPDKKAEAFDPFSALLLGVATNVITDGIINKRPQPNPPTIWLGPSFDARVNQPIVGLPDKEGKRKVVFPYDLVFEVRQGYIAWVIKHGTTHVLYHGSDVTPLAKGEPVWVKATSGIQELLDQVGTSLVKNQVVMPTGPTSPPQSVVTAPPVQQPVTPPPNQIVHPSDAVDIENMTVSFLADCQGYKYRGKITKVYVSSGVRVDYWDHRSQTARQAYKGDVFESGDFTWYR